MMSSLRGVEVLSAEATARNDERAIDWRPFLDRPPFTLCPSTWESLFRGKRVLITGAGGSIGSTLALRLMRGFAGTLILLDHSEQNLSRVQQRHKQSSAVLPRTEFIQGDILSQNLLEQIFSTYRPDIVFHAAALKHLPELESAPFAALGNNLLGTMRVLKVAEASSVECFVNVSTDKAVNPTSMLGVSKRLAELFVMTVDSTVPRKISLRMGNVLGSSGSVVPIFVQSMKDRQSLRVTDPQAARYFVTMEEAADFLIAAAQMSTSSLLLPKMGTPRRITELADFLRNQLGSENGRERVEFIGLRDGEKLCEELTYSYEYLVEAGPTGIRKICGNAIADPERFSDNLGTLLEGVRKGRKENLIASLSNLVPEFIPSAALVRYLS